MDNTTKFLVGDHLSKERNYRECNPFLENVKEYPVNQPYEIHTYCSYEYPLPVKKVFGKRGIIHAYFPSWKCRFKNNPIERLHN